MSAIDFAMKYAGKRVKLAPDLLPAAVVENIFEGYSFYGQVVGYVTGDTERVIIELDDFREHCWALYDGITLVIDPDDLYNRQDTRVISVNYKEIEPPISRDELRASIINRKTAPPIVPPPAYPKTCKVCCAPARNYGKQTMCSNRACTTRHKVLGSLAIKRVKTRPIRCPVKNGGEVCNKFATYCSSPKSRGILQHQATYYLVDCEGGHTYNLSIDSIRVNDTISFTRGNNDSSDRIWNGTKWETY